MKIELPKEEDGFILKDGIIGGDRVTLVFPSHIGTRWNKDNLIFRSSIWTPDGEPVSLGFKKFFNYGEHSELAGDPRDLKKINIIEKIDGSCLIVSSYKKQLIIRTRQTFGYESMDNAHEIELLKAKYPRAFDTELLELTGRSHIFEWVSPMNRIVIGHSEPDLYLTGVISHHDYSYKDQWFVDEQARILGVPRPQKYSFEHVDTALKAINEWTGKEGTCFYFNKDQDIKKVKSLWYLAIHRFKEKCDFEHILDYFLSNGAPEFPVFKELIIKDYDYECLSLALPFASKISDAYKEVKQIEEHMKKFIEPLKALNVKYGFREGRKRAAAEIGKAYGTTNRASFAFALLDGKEFGNDEIKKLVFQVMKK